MKVSVRLICLAVCAFVLMAFLPFTSSASATHLENDGALTGIAKSVAFLQQIPSEDKLVIGSSFVLSDGEVISGSLYIVGGSVKISSGAAVEKDVAIIGGNLDVHGAIGGDMNVLGGSVTIGATAHIKGDINSVSTHLVQNERAQVDGKINNLYAGPFSAIIPGGFQLPQMNGIPPISIPNEPSTANGAVEQNWIWKVIWWWIRSFIYAALAVLAVLFFPRVVDRVAEAATRSTVVSGGLGLVTVVIAPLILLLLALTICALPVSLVLGLLLTVAWVFGFIAIGSETGKRLITKLNLDWADPVSAALGTFSLTLLANGIGLLVPCVGWIVPALIGVIGLGAAILTRFGTKDYSP